MFARAHTHVVSALLAQRAPSVADCDNTLSGANVRTGIWCEISALWGRSGGGQPLAVARAWLACLARLLARWPAGWLSDWLAGGGARPELAGAPAWGVGVAARELGGGGEGGQLLRECTPAALVGPK